MPKVEIKKRAGAYVPNQFKAWIRYKDIQQKQIAEWLGCTQGAVSKKLSAGNMDIKEIAIVFDRGGATPEEIVKVLTL